MDFAWVPLVVTAENQNGDSLIERKDHPSPDVTGLYRPYNTVLLNLNITNNIPVLVVSDSFNRTVYPFLLFFVETDLNLFAALVW
jgi:hypothetical protein